MSVVSAGKPRLLYDTRGRYLGLYEVSQCGICKGPAFKALQVWPLHQTESHCLVGAHTGASFRAGNIGHGFIWAGQLEALKSLYKTWPSRRSSHES